MSDAPAPAPESPGHDASLAPTDGPAPLRDAQLRAIFETAGEGILSVDLSHKVVAANPAAAAMFGVPLDELIGSPLSRWVPDRYRDSHERRVKDFMASRQPTNPMGQRRGFLARRATGEEFPVAAGISQVEVDGDRLFSVILCDLSAQIRAETALHTSEQLLAAAFGASAVGMVRIDPHTHRFTAANAAFCRLSGFDEHELLSLGVDDLNHPEDPLDVGRFQAMLAGHAPYRTEKRILRKDGQVIWVAVDGSVILDRHGRPEAVLGIVQDITARRDAEIARRDRDARQAFIIRLSDHLREQKEPQAIVRDATSMVGEFASASRVGYAEDDGNGETVTVTHSRVDGVPAIEGHYRYDDYGPALLQTFHEGRTVARPDIAGDPTLTEDEKAAHAALQVGAMVGVPLRKRDRLEAVFFVHSREARHWTHEEVAFYEDVAERLRADLERTRAEVRLRATRTTLETALESMTDAVAITDEKGRFLAFNTAYATFNRFPSKDAVPRSVDGYLTLFEALGPDGAPIPPEQWAIPRALRGEVASDAPYELRRTDTGERWMAGYSFAPIRDADGSIAGAVAVGRDLTDWYRVQRRLQDAHEELQRLAAARDRAQEDERRRIARELHDELLQSLARIAIDAATAGEDMARDLASAGEALQQIVRVAEQAIASTRRIIQDLRPQALEDLGLAAALHELARQFTQRSQVRCEVHVTSSETDTVDRALGTLGTSLYRMAQEALTNVGKHAGARSVQIALADAPGHRLRLTVADDGKGMDTQAAPSDQSFGLLGIRERVRAAGGTLAIESEPGRGTRIDIEVPLPSDGLAGNAGS